MLSWLKWASQAANNLSLVSFISRSRPNFAAAATISAFFILVSADLDNVLSIPVFDSADEVSESLSDLGADPFKSAGFSGSLLASTASDLPSSLEKKPFFFVSFVSLIT